MIIIDERSGYGKEKCDDPFVSLLVHRVDVVHKKVQVTDCLSYYNTGK